MAADTITVNTSISVTSSLVAGISMIQPNMATLLATSECRGASYNVPLGGATITVDFGGITAASLFWVSSNLLSKVLIAPSGGANHSVACTVFLMVVTDHPVVLGLPLGIAQVITISNNTRIDILVAG